MEVRIGNLFLKVFVVAFFSTIIGVLLKLNHFQYSGLFFIIGVISTVIYVVIGIYEVNNSTRIKSSEKVLWTIGFLLFNFFVGLFYMIKRKDIV